MLYEPSLKFIRQIEIYQALHPLRPIRVYFLLYDNSVEERSHFNALRKEKGSFEHLISSKAKLVTTSDQDGKLMAALPTDFYKSDTRVSKFKGGIVNNSKKILVDMREFRSDLPFALYLAQCVVLPKTLNVGDYILAPNIAVERKSLSDLISSFNSGHLYNQMVSFCRKFASPILLIEFDNSRPFIFAGDGHHSGLDMTKIHAKLVLLCLHFPTMKIIWSRNDYFIYFS